MTAYPADFPLKCPKGSISINITETFEDLK